MDKIRRAACDKNLWEHNGVLQRYKFNPILEAKKEHYWESKMVYNAAAFKLDGVNYIVYRALGHDHISRLGLAWTNNGIDIIGRLPFPIFEPTQDYEYPSDENKAMRSREKGGCEDPRITLIDDTIYMVYTAYSELCQTAIASIKINDFKELLFKSSFSGYESEDQTRNNWNRAWDRHGLVFPKNVKKRIFSRNACVFPVDINHKTVKYGLIYRLEKSEVMIAFSDTPIGPWKEHKIFLEPTKKWEGERMGICSPPVKTEHGLFFVYHGVDHLEKKHVRRNYRLGGLFLNFDILNDKLQINVNKIKDPILSPERGYEEQSAWLEPKDVFAVFCCGTVPFENKEFLKDDDELLIFYGAGDIRICTAKAKISELYKLTN